MSLDDALERDAQLEELRAANRRLVREVEKTRIGREELVDAVYRAARDSASALSIPKVTKPPADRRRKTPETAVFVPADWQLAKITPDYDSDACEERITRYVDKALDLVSIQRADHPIRNAHIWALGDLVEGELIFPGQAHHVDASLYRQVTVDGPRILGDLIRRVASDFEHVTFHGVIGNHGALGGRSRRDYNPESNADRMLYRITQQVIAQDPDLAKRITWHIPDGDGERNWYSIAEIGDYRCLLAHGDQIRGHAGFPWYGLAKKVWGWATGAVSDEFDDVFIGHWHQPTRVTLNRFTVRVSGSPESTNTYAAEQLAAVGRPSQWLLFVHPEKGVTAEYCVWLDK